MTLYERVKREDSMAFFVHSKPLVASKELDTAVSYLHSTLRNKFEHFLPGGWSILIDELPAVVFWCISAIAFRRAVRQHLLVRESVQGGG